MSRKVDRPAATATPTRKLAATPVRKAAAVESAPNWESVETDCEAAPPDPLAALLSLPADVRQSLAAALLGQPAAPQPTVNGRILPQAAPSPLPLADKAASAYDTLPFEVSAVGTINRYDDDGNVLTEVRDGKTVERKKTVYLPDSVREYVVDQLQGKRFEIALIDKQTGNVFGTTKTLTIGTDKDGVNLILKTKEKQPGLTGIIPIVDENSNHSMLSVSLTAAGSWGAMIAIEKFEKVRNR